MIKLGDSNISFAVGNSAVTYIYLGSTLIYDATPVATTAFTASYNDGSDPISVNCADLSDGQLLSANTKPINRVASAMSEAAIGDCVTSIGADAFRDCSGLTSITIPNSVTDFGDSALRSCTSLSSVTLPSGLTSITSNLMRFCLSLTSITIPDSVTSIGNDAFINCISLNDVTIPDSVTSIGQRGFAKCSGATSFTIGTGITNIDIRAFSGCTSLTSMTFNAVTPPTLGSDTSLFGTYPIYVPSESVQSYKDAWSAYTGYAERIEAIPVPANYKLRAVYNNGAPDLVVECGHNGNSTLIVGYNNDEKEAGAVITSAVTDAFIGDCTTTIGGAVLSNCPNLTGINISDSVVEVYSNSFSGTTPLEVEGNIKYVGKWAISATSKQSSYTLKEGTVGIARDCFAQNTSLSSISVPSSLKYVNIGAFTGCSNLSSQDNIQYAAPEIAVRAANKTRTSYTVRDGCKWIISDASYSSGCFRGCSAATSITLPDSIIYLDNGTFSACSGLTSMTIPSGVTKIPNSCFSSCKSLSSITLPTGITEIGYGAFDSCPITSISIPTGVTKVGGAAFERSKLTSITINTIETINESTFLWCNSLLNATFNNAKSIDFQAFNYSTSLTSITIPNVTDIHPNAFFGCTGFPATNYIRYAADKCAIKVTDSGQTSYTILPTTITITQNCFENCTNLESIVIPASVKIAGNSAFGNCTSLTSVTIGNPDIQLQPSTFQGCTGLPQTNYFYLDDAGTFILGLADGEQSAYVIPDGVSVIPDSLFSNAWNIESLTLPSSTTKINGEVVQMAMGLVVTCNAVDVPQTSSSRPFGYDVQNIYVPSESVDDYKSAWTEYSSLIEAIE